MRSLIAAFALVAISGCGSGYEKPPKLPVDNTYVYVGDIRPFGIGGHDYYMVGYGESRVAVPDHECPKCRAELTRKIKELMKLDGETKP